MKTALLIPIYEPTEKVLPFLSEFEEGDFDAFLVVDDGSGEDFQERFDAVKETTPFDVIGYPKNQGKGVALKLGMAELLLRHPEIDGIVTADGDGQHTRTDILRVRDELRENPETLVLGVRDFHNAPKRSISGNKWMSRLFRLNTGRLLNDTQTGLRGIPKCFFDLALSASGRRYEYEMNFLTEAANEGELKAIEIETIYENNNAGSHFRGFRDSMRFLTPILCSFGVCVIGWALELAVFFAANAYLFDSSRAFLPILASTALGRFVSAPFVFLMLNFAISHHRGKARKAIGRFAFLTILSMLASAGLTFGFGFIASSLVFIKAVVDALVGVVKFLVSRIFVFTDRRIRRKR